MSEADFLNANSQFSIKIKNNNHLGPHHPENIILVNSANEHHQLRGDYALTSREEKCFPIKDNSKIHF
jgi:hypothetical protein